MVSDPLVVALATAMEGLLQRGLEIHPCGDGWTIKLVQENVVGNGCDASVEPEQVRRAW